MKKTTKYTPSREEVIEGAGFCSLIFFIVFMLLLYNYAQ